MLRSCYVFSAVLLLCAQADACVPDLQCLSNVTSNDTTTCCSGNMHRTALCPLTLGGFNIMCGDQGPPAPPEPPGYCVPNGECMLSMNYTCCSHYSHLSLDCPDTNYRCNTPHNGTCVGAGECLETPAEKCCSGSSHATAGCPEPVQKRCDPSPQPGHCVANSMCLPNPNSTCCSGYSHYTVSCPYNRCNNPLPPGQCRAAGECLQAPAEKCCSGSSHHTAECPGPASKRCNAASPPPPPPRPPRPPHTPGYNPNETNRNDLIFIGLIIFGTIASIILCYCKRWLCFRRVPRAQAAVPQPAVLQEPLIAGHVEAGQAGEPHTPPPYERGLE